MPHCLYRHAHSSQGEKRIKSLFSSEIDQGLPTWMQSRCSHDTISHILRVKSCRLKCRDTHLVLPCGP